MKRQFPRVTVITVAVLIGTLIGISYGRKPRRLGRRARSVQVVKPKKIQRFGSVIGLKADKKDYYNKLHANPWPEVDAMLKKCNIQNYSIYEVELDGKLYLFSYFEYTGDDFKADAAKLAANPKVKEWWAETDPCQIRLPGTPEGEQWLGIEPVYHLD